MGATLGLESIRGQSPSAPGSKDCPSAISRGRGRRSGKGNWRIAMETTAGVPGFAVIRISTDGDDTAELGGPVAHHAGEAR